MLDDDSDNDDGFIIDNILGPKLAAPTINPWRPYSVDTSHNKSSPADVTNIDHEFQYASVMAQSLYSSNDQTNGKELVEISPPASPESLNSHHIFDGSGGKKVSVSHVDDEDDALSVSMTESSILDSYYNNDYKAWEMDANNAVNIPVEEDEDSDGDLKGRVNISSTGTGTLYGAAKPKQGSQTRMRSPSAGDPISSNRRASKPSKGAKFVKKRSKAVAASTMIPRVTLESGSSDDDKFQPAPIIKQPSPSAATAANGVKRSKELRFAALDEYESDTRPHGHNSEILNDKSDDNSIEEISSGSNKVASYEAGFHRNVATSRNSNSTSWTTAKAIDKIPFQQRSSKPPYSLSESESSVELSDKEPSKFDAEKFNNLPDNRAGRGPKLVSLEDEEDEDVQERRVQRARNPLDLSLETLPIAKEGKDISADNGVMLFDFEDNEPEVVKIKPVQPRTTWGSREDDESDQEQKQTEQKPSKPVIWKSVKRVSVKSVSLSSEQTAVAYRKDQDLLREGDEWLSPPKNSELVESPNSSHSNASQLTIENIKPDDHSADRELEYSNERPPIAATNRQPILTSRDSPLIFDANDVGEVDVGAIQVSPLPLQRQPQGIIDRKVDGTPERHEDPDKLLAIAKLKANILQKKNRSEVPQPQPQKVGFASESPLPASGIAILPRVNNIEEKISEVQTPPLMTDEPFEIGPKNLSALKPPAVSSSVQFETVSRGESDSAASRSADAKVIANRHGSGSGVSSTSLPPRTAAVPPTDRSVAAMGPSLQSSVSSSGAMFQLLPEHYQPPPLSEFAEECGVIVEGFLNKKSSVTGMWQQRYFVLAESATEFCVLRIFGKTVQSNWGLLPLEIKRSIPVHQIDRVDTITSKGSKGKEFTIRIQTSSVSPVTGSRPSSLTRKSFSFSGFQRNSGSFSSNGAADGGEKVTHLQAPDAETRLLWVTMLNRAINAFLVQLD